MRKTCVNCGTDYIPTLSGLWGFQEKYLRWRNGESIQDVWPDATATAREQLITGICSDKCWNQFLGVSPDTN